MNSKIVLNGKELIGIGNIVISELDDVVYFNNSNQVEENVKGALAFYHSDKDSLLVGTGNYCVWDSENKVLKVLNINSFDIVTTHIKSSTIGVDDFLMTTKLAVKKWIGFSSKGDSDRHPFKVSLSLDSNKKETLIFTYEDYDAKIKPDILMALGNSRLQLKNVNIKNRTVETPVGTLQDLAGDIVIDNSFIYYCTKNFDGVSAIWKRTELKEWT